MIHISLPRPPRLDGGPRQVRITQCSDPMYWYQDRVGQTILCEFVDSEGYWAREGGVFNAINVIRPEDATLLPLEN